MLRMKSPARLLIGNLLALLMLLVVADDASDLR